MYELAYSLCVKYVIAKPMRTCTVSSKAQLSFLIKCFSNTLIKVEKSAFAGAVFGGLSDVRTTHSDEFWRL